MKVKPVHVDIVEHSLIRLLVEVVERLVLVYDIIFAHASPKALAAATICIRLSNQCRFCLVRGKGSEVCPTADDGNCCAGLDFGG